MSVQFLADASRFCGVPMAMRMISLLIFIGTSRKESRAVSLPRVISSEIAFANPEDIIQEVTRPQALSSFWLQKKSTGAPIRRQVCLQDL